MNAAFEISIGKTMNNSGYLMKIGSIRFGEEIEKQIANGIKIIKKKLRSLTSLKKGDIGNIFNAAFEAQYTLIPATACWNSEIGAIFTVVLDG